MKNNNSNNPKEAKTTAKRKLSGIVVSNKMDKTVVVRVDRALVHPTYKKRIKVSKNYQVHDEKNSCKEGDKVIFTECRPMSKQKKWRVVYDSLKSKA